MSSDGSGKSAHVQTLKSHRCSHTRSMDVDKVSRQHGRLLKAFMQIQSSSELKNPFILCSCSISLHANSINAFEKARFIEIKLKICIS